jgi:AcrR family transcriptional regulator
LVKKADIPRHIVATAIGLAATQGWRDTTLGDIADAAKLTLAEVHAHYRSKAAIVAAFTRQIDAAVLDGDDPELAAQPAPDRLFDVLMRRFDALNAHKAGVRAIIGDSLGNPCAMLSGACALERSMTWMLSAAHIGTSGLGGLLRVRGLTAIYLAVLRVWLADDSQDMAATMAALDKRLHQADAALATLCRLPIPGRKRGVTESA